MMSTLNAAAKDAALAAGARAAPARLEQNVAKRAKLTQRVAEREGKALSSVPRAM